MNILTRSHFPWRISNVRSIPTIIPANTEPTVQESATQGQLNLYISGHTQQLLTPLTQLLSRGRGKGGGYAIAGVKAYSETTQTNCFKYMFFWRNKVNLFLRRL